MSHEVQFGDAFVGANFPVSQSWHRVAPCALDFPASQSAHVSFGGRLPIVPGGQA